VCAGLGIVLTGEWVSWVAIGWKEGRGGLAIVWIVSQSADNIRGVKVYTAIRNVICVS
jgi:hypothetical protein